MSHIIAISQPPPRAKPLTAATIGVFDSARAVQLDRKFPLQTSLNDLFCISLISAPAANARLEPVKIMQPIDGSESNFFTACSSSDINSAFKAFNALGRTC
ncbi:hypothetical protein BpHYR1_019871 [Brachionus plicatilis]|uniref:Uncharacterized protein n=1 Tax=Brachionus plicatilis TaxID=10195 RepID=A0A3M7T8W0_BRAPC|nr:hypothetical protein BpHYR1_019871 [Brachionus plicatilis]